MEPEYPFDRALKSCDSATGLGASNAPGANFTRQELWKVNNLISGTITPGRGL